RTGNRVFTSPSLRKYRLPTVWKRRSSCASILTQTIASHYSRTRMKRFSFAILCAAISTFSLISLAQTSDQNGSQKSKARYGAITGKVVDDSGTPVANARVFVSAQSVQGVRQTVFTDEAGKFVAEDLPRASYSVTVQVAGYTPVRQPG